MKFLPTTALLNMSKGVSKINRYSELKETLSQDRLIILAFNMSGDMSISHLRRLQCTSCFNFGYFTSIMERLRRRGCRLYVVKRDSEYHQPWTDDLHFAAFLYTI